MLRSIPWRQSINPNITDIETVRGGDVDGYGGIFNIHLKTGRVISAIALPHHYPSRTGPTWAYLTDNDGLTLIDAGSQGAQRSLEEGLSILGQDLNSISKLILTHGHQDHDGNGHDFIVNSGAELWAHKMYFDYLNQDFFDYKLDPNSYLHTVVRKYTKQMLKWQEHPSNSKAHEHWTKVSSKYKSGRAEIMNGGILCNVINDGDISGDFTFLYTPGHSVDQICIYVDGVIFTGDHVLPQISPHPTFRQTLPNELRKNFRPTQFLGKDHFGLERYIKSLARILHLDPHISVLPAHRLYNHNRLHIRNVNRCKEIVRHHIRRLEKIVEALNNGPSTVEGIARNVFPSRKLSGGGIYAAVNEIVSHLELLIDSGDIQVSTDDTIESTGISNFHNYIDAIIS